MNALVGLVQRALRRITRLVARATEFARSVTAAATTRTLGFARSSRSRLTARWHTDGPYRRTLIAAISALVATVLPHPAAAAALGALLAEPARGHHRPAAFIDDYDEDDYPPRRTPTDPWATSPRRLWDSLE